ncbi:MAG: imidazole glycerol phosphate synthase subunit HisF [SAR202 cluster bacterium]|jgi:cyclase|nr:imidazole glycerol phosphate synthase subunit HisF [Dehalococcoidia bacterium]MQG85066.1 imidazole glycerol phosphate synthase subunit HisF [SAR202 cluster bacterium]|tara:strand:+ start:1042 stop:1818 length:777 start_codon:yes stop_codon:yes gene_type:complete
MLTKRIIPCLDVKLGRVVKGVQFLDHVDAGDPVELAGYYNQEGADELVFYDITASSDDRNIMIEVVSQTAEQVFIPLTVGGGIRTIEDVNKMLLAGADKVSINTAAVQRPEFIEESAKAFGSQCIVVGIDVIRSNNGQRFTWTVKTHTGRDGGRSTGLDAIEWVKQVVELGAGEIVLNSIDSDGMLSGYDIDLLQAVSKYASIPVVASGGAGKLSDFSDAIINGNADAVLAASIFHFNKYSIKEVKNYLDSKDIAVRF